MRPHAVRVPANTDETSSTVIAYTGESTTTPHIKLPKKKYERLCMAGSQTVVIDRIAGHDVYRHSLLTVDGAMRTSAEEEYLTIMRDFWQDLIH